MNVTYLRYTFIVSILMVVIVACSYYAYLNIYIGDESNLKEKLESMDVIICREEMHVPNNPIDKHIGSRIFPHYYNKTTAITAYNYSSLPKPAPWIKMLPRLPYLESVNLSNYAISKSALQQIGSCEKIKELLLPGCKVDDDGAMIIADMDNVAILDLSYTDVTSRCLPYFKKTSALVELRLFGTGIDENELRESRLAYDEANKEGKIIIVLVDNGRVGVAENVGQDKKDSNEFKESEE